MKWIIYALLGLFTVSCNESSNHFDEQDVASSPKGKLFIIGGGDRTPELMERMLVAAGIDTTQYIAVLPMSSEEPDSAFENFAADVHKVYNVSCVNLNFTEADLINRHKLDSVKNARIIFITGGDQNRFMLLAKDTPLQDAIITAYNNGSLIAGTSAGAAVLSKVMITGDENFSPEYSPSYDKVWKGNGIYAEGLGLLSTAIVDQHFVKRSRYNRLLSALCDHPGNIGIGIDEETALLVEGNNGTVIGDSQVVVFDDVDSCGVYFNHLRMRDVRMDIYTSGDVFEVTNNRKK